MLQAMQQSAAAPLAPPSHSFAELLAALEAPARKTGVPGDRSSSQGWETGVPGDRSSSQGWETGVPGDRSSSQGWKTGVPGDRSSSQGWQREPAWSDDGLADDYATLSYERALRAHARHRSADPPDAPSDLSLTGSADPGPGRNREAFPAAALPAGLTETPRAAFGSHAEVQPQTAFGLPAALNRNLKSASITIRLSQPESAQLRKRAAEAGLTVSAYLRSCTFEAESLRALVKDTLAQLRSEPSRANRAKGDQAVANQAAANQAAPRPIRRSWRQWWRRLWPWAHSSNCMAQA
jgi:hypothetical protein